MSSINELNDQDPNVFYPVEDLILEGFITHQEAASAIEIVGIQAYDNYGRFVILNPNKESKTNYVSIEKALATIDENLRGECNRIHNSQPDIDPRTTNEYWRLQAELPLVSVYGWMIKDLPDFKALYKQWCQQETGLNPEELPNNTVPAQSAAKKLIRGLVVLCYGNDEAEKLDLDRSPLPNKIKRELELKGFSFDEKTLRKWLKNN